MTPDRPTTVDLPAESPAAPRGRWAPSPTGPFHLGSARTALVAWLSARSGGGAFVWRVEDLDPPRTVPAAAEEQIADLAWLGLDWDEGPLPAGAPGEGAAGAALERGPHTPYRQSLREAVYRDALARLEAAGRLFPCRRSRRDLQGLASAPHGAGGVPPYPAGWRPRRLEAGWLERLLAAERPDAAVRFRVDAAPVRFRDLLQGEIEERVAETVGDFVLRRRDGLWAYQLAVVADDLAMGITEVVRGADLLASTGRQIQLVEALGGARPAYAHVPLVLNAAGEKLSKRDGGATLAELRAAGVAPERVVGWLAFTLGLAERPEAVQPHELVPRFAWRRLRREPWVLAGDPVAEIRRAGQSEARSLLGKPRWEGDLDELRRSRLPDPG
jgi:glutamyl-tRNA synthetase